MKSLVWNGAWSVTMASADDDIESEALSVFLLGVNLAIIVGPVIGGFLIASRGFSITFGLWTFTSVLAILVFLSYLGLETQKPFVDSLEDLFHRETYFNDWHHLRENWENLKFPFALIFFYGIIFAFFWLAIPLLLDRIGADFVTMGLIFGLAALPKAFQFIFGEIADRAGKSWTLIGLSLILTPVLVSMNFVSGIFAVGAVFFFARFFTEGMSPAIHAMFDSRVPEEIESEMTGFFELFKHAGTAIGPVLAGTVASIWNLNTSFLAAALVSVLIFILSLTIPKS